MPSNSAPSIEGPEAFLNALRDPGRNLKEKYRDDPLALAERFGVKLPRKPVLVMIDLGVLTEEEATERFGNVRPGLREMVLDVCTLEEKSTVAIANRGGGKAIAVDTPIPTPDGWTTMGELCEGDVVYDAQGKPCNVTKAYRTLYRRPCYEIVFSDGSSVVADEDHLWLTSTATSRHADRYATGGGRTVHQTRTAFESVKTTREILNTVTISAGKGRRDHHHQIRNSEPIRFPKKKLLVDPYLLGLWLGDGHSHCGYITVGAGDETVMDGVPNATELQGSGSAHLYKVDSLKENLSELGLLRNKHVPQTYLRGSRGQRLALLCGLMDSDGTTRATSNNCQFDNTNERLADAVYELVVSLGWKATRKKRPAKLYGVEHGVVHQVSFRPTTQVFRNPRKASRLDFSVSQESRHTNRVIKEVRKVPSVPVRCIEVDSPSRLFLCGEQMVPTHNSFGVSFIEFYLWMLRDFDALNLGGSELQADQVYRYILGYMEEDEFWQSLLKGEPQRERTYTKEDAWVRVLTASSKSVRSPHAGGMRKGKLRGGILVIDEEAETEEEIVSAALSTINTARPSVSVRCSTFHNLEGSFQEVVDNHEEMGYKLYQWDIFDVAERCECVGVCQAEEECFREDHFDYYIDPDDGEMKKKLVHKAYCGGRAMYADGWIPLEEITILWKRMRRNHSRWEVEAMGSRPSTSGFAIKDLTKFATNIVSETGEELYLSGAPVYIDVDWGTGAAGVCVWQSQPGQEVLLHADLVKDNNQTQMNGIILGYAARYRHELVEVAADIGGGGNYMNPSLRLEHRQNVRDVNFNEEKEAAVAAFNIKNEAGEVVIPAEHVEFVHQCRNWKRKNGKIQKGNDHLCDSGIVCHFSRFIDEMGLSRIRTVPRSFHSNSNVRDTPVSVEPKSPTDSRRRRARLPIVRTFGGNGRR